MKKLILALVLVLAFALPVLAGEEVEEGDDFSGTVTIGVDYLSTGELVDSTEVSIETDISDDATVGITLTIEELVFGTPAVSVEGVLKYTIDEEETAEVGANFDVITSDIEVYGQYKGLPVTDEMLLSGKILGAFPVNTYHAVATLVYDINEDTELLVEARFDSDGTEVFSAEAQLKYAITEDIDVKVGYELNDWSDDINDWDGFEITDGVDKAYAEVVFKF